MALRSLGGAWQVFRRVERLLEDDRLREQALGKLSDRLAALEARVARLETREDVVIARAERAASDAAHQSTADLSRRIGALEALVRLGSSRVARPRAGKALPPPVPDPDDR